MKITEFVENADGSAVVIIDLTEQEKSEMIEYAFIHMLKEVIAKEKNEGTN